MYSFFKKPVMALSLSAAIATFGTAVYADEHSNEEVADTETPADVTTETTKAQAVISHNEDGTSTIEVTKETEEGEIRIEMTVREGDDDDDVDLKIYKNGRELSDEETDAELEEWEAEVMDTLEDAFRGNPRKGIFALNQDRDGGFLELGFGMKSSDGLTKMREETEGVNFNTELNISVQLGGLFYEYYSESGENGLFGLNFYNNDYIGLDLLIGKEHDSFAKDKEDTLLLPINVRHADWTAGFRSSIYLGPLVLQGQVRKEITDYHSGYSASLQTGTRIQIKNLNLHGLVGASYQSKEMTNYYYGVSASEANANFSEYTAGEDLSYHAEVGATFPIDEDWVLRGQVNYEQFSDSLINSPFWEGDSNERISSRLMLMLVI